MKPARSTDWLDKLLIAVFVIALLTPVAFFNSDEQATAAEKRTLAPAPSLPRSKAELLAFPETFNNWFSDHFGFRQALIKTHSRFSFFILHSSPSPKVILGRDDFIFLKGTPEADGDPIADFRGTVPLTPYELERWRWQLEDQHAWLRDRGIAFYFAVIPGKEHMNAKFMPAGFENIGRPGAYDQFVSHIAPRATYPFIDVRRAMQAANERTLIYRKTDTHWNDLGAWAGVFTLTDAIRAAYTNLPRFTTNDLTFTVVDYRVGDMGNMLGLPGETYEPLVQIRRKDSPVAATPLSDHPLGDILTTIETSTNLPRAVLFHDSFGHYLKPLLGEYFRWLRFRWSNAGIDRNIVEDSKPDLVIHLMAERRIRLSQRYEIGVQQFGNRDRFERLGQTLSAWDSTSGFADITTPEGVTGMITSDGLNLRGSTRPAGFTLPPIPVAASHLPVIRIECSVPEHDELALSWTNQTLAFPQMAKAVLQTGRNVVYLPVLDPEIQGPIHVDIVRSSDQLTLHNVEIRIIPR